MAAGAAVTGRNRQAWQQAICASGLPASSRLVAHTVAVGAGQSGQQGIWLSSTDIANMSGLKSLQTVNVYLRKLIELGWLRKIDGAWFLTWPGELDFPFEDDTAVNHAHEFAGQSGAGTG